MVLLKLTVLLVHQVLLKMELNANVMKDMQHTIISVFLIAQVNKNFYKL